jgi:hypothetical protein
LCFGSAAAGVAARFARSATEAAHRASFDLKPEVLNNMASSFFHDRFGRRRGESQNRGEPILNAPFIRRSGFRPYFLIMRLSVFIMAATLFAGVPAAGPVAACSDRGSGLELAQSDNLQPLPAIMARVEREVPGRVVDVQLDQSRSPWRYRFKVLTEAGNIVSVVCDAETGQILSIRGKR